LVQFDDKKRINKSLFGNFSLVGGSESAALAVEFRIDLVVVRGFGGNDDFGFRPSFLRFGDLS